MSSYRQLRSNLYVEYDAPVFLADGFFTTLVDFSLAYGINDNKLLSNTAIFYEDLKSGGSFCSANQYIQLIRNVNQYLYNIDGLELEVGKFSVNQLYIPLANLVSHCQSLDEAIGTIKKFYLFINPLLSLHVISDNDFYYLLLTERFSLSESSKFVFKSMLSSLSELLSLFGGEIIQSRFYLSESEPDECSNLYKRLGMDITFSSSFNVMVIPRMQVASSDKHTSAIAYKRYLSECEAISKKIILPPSLIEHIHEFVIKNCGENNISLEACAKYLSLSRSALKRKLSKNSITYQAILDESRSLLSIKQLYLDELTVDETAHNLGFNDKTNFRRSFKRWTKKIPSDFRR